MMSLVFLVVVKIDLLVFNLVLVFRLCSTMIHTYALFCLPWFCLFLWIDLIVGAVVSGRVLVWNWLTIQYFHHLLVFISNATQHETKKAIFKNNPRNKKLLFQRIFIIFRTFSLSLRCYESELVKYFVSAISWEFFQLCKWCVNKKAVTC